MFARFKLYIVNKSSNSSNNNSHNTHSRQCTLMHRIKYIAIHLLSSNTMRTGRTRNTSPTIPIRETVVPLIHINKILRALLITRIHNLVVQITYSSR